MPCSAGHKDCGRPVPGDILSFFKLKSSNLIACPHFTLQKGREGFVFFQCNFFRIHTGFLSFHCLTRTLFGRWKRLDSVTCLEVVSFISLKKRCFPNLQPIRKIIPLQFTHFQWLMVSWFGVEPAFVLGPNSTRAAPQISTCFCETRKTHLLFPSCLLVVVIIIALLISSTVSPRFGAPDSWLCRSNSCGYLRQLVEDGPWRVGATFTKGQSGTFGSGH